MARWDPSEHVLIVRNEAVGDDTIVHEMTHAYNDIVMGGVDLRPDEGMGYAMQAFYQLNVRLKSFETGLQRLGCNVPYTKSNWQDFWRDYGVIPGLGWGKGKAGSKPFDVNLTDYSNMKAEFGINLSCKDLALAFNSILQANGCCFRVTCSGDTFGCESDLCGQISPGHTIIPFFK